MIDGVGNVSSVLVIGANNPFCLAIVDRLVGPRLATITLMDSNVLSLSRGAERIRGFGIPEVRDVAYRPGDTTTQRELVAELFARGDIDVVIISPSPQRSSQVNLDGASSVMNDYLQRALLDTAYLAEECAAAIARQGHGVICMLTHAPESSPKASPERDNEYCATMAALALLAPTISATVAANGGRVVCAQFDPVKDPNAFTNGYERSTTVTPIDAASTIASFIISKRKRRPYEVVPVPKSVKGVAKRFRR